jgi:hypothetical protein
MTRLVHIQMKRRGVEMRWVIPSEAVTAPRSDPLCFAPWPAAINGLESWRPEKLPRPSRLRSDRDSATAACAMWFL